MAISPSLVDHMAFGATGSDAMNGATKRWFCGVVQMNASFLRLKLRVFHLRNMSAFRSAMYNKTIAHVRNPLVFIRENPNGSALGNGSIGIRREIMTT